MADRFRLDGKTALVTGAASGLGAAIALALAEAGAAVACHGNRRPAEETAGEIRKLGREGRSFSADLSTEDGAERLFSDVVVAMGAPDILVNNAGTIHRAAAEDHELEAWKRVLQVNLTSAFQLCQLAGREMLKRRQGKIIYIASMMSFQGGIRIAAYRANAVSMSSNSTRQRQRMAASSIAMEPPAAMNGRTGWQASPISTTRPMLQQSLRARACIGHTVTSIAASAARSRSG